MEMDLIIVPDELEHSDMETACKRNAILSHANGVVLDVGAAETAIRVCERLHILNL